MGDDKRYTIQIKGTAYKFLAVTPEDATKLMVVANMNASPTKLLLALTKVLKAAAGADQWDAITDRLVNDEITMTDLSEVFSKLANRQTKDSKPAADVQ